MTFPCETAPPRKARALTPTDSTDMTVKDDLNTDDTNRHKSRKGTKLLGPQIYTENNGQVGDAEMRRQGLFQGSTSLNDYLIAPISPEIM